MFLLFYFPGLLRLVRIAERGVAEGGAPFQLQPGDIIALELPGGGGFGPPEQRDESLRLADRQDGLI